MVTLNVATEANLANNSRGTIEDIVLDPREEINGARHDQDGVVWLQYPPAMILFQPFHYKFEPLLSLEPGLILTFPSEVSFNINYQQNSHTTVHWRQSTISNLCWVCIYRPQSTRSNTWMGDDQHWNNNEVPCNTICSLCGVVAQQRQRQCNYYVTSMIQFSHGIPSNICIWRMTPECKHQR